VTRNQNLSRAHEAPGTNAWPSILGLSRPRSSRCGNGIRRTRAMKALPMGGTLTVTLLLSLSCSSPPPLPSGNDQDNPQNWYSGPHPCTHSPPCAF